MHYLSITPREESVYYWVLALSFLFFFIAEIIWKRSSVQKFRVEVVWTIIPALVLVLLCFSNRHPGKNISIRNYASAIVRK